MPFLTQLADVARRTGYPVVEVAGWRTRGHGPQPRVHGIVCHHTAGWSDLGVVRDGRRDLPGPLSQFWLQRTGRIFVVAAGRCWHNAPSTSPNHANSTSVGIEAENDGETPWPVDQLDAYHRLCAALCDEFDLPASRVRGHREVNRGKVDPHSIDMGDFRARVARLLVDGITRPGPREVVSGTVPDFVTPLRLVSPMLRGAHVKAWQAAARRFAPGLVADGWYGPDSVRACKAVQRAVAVPVTGVVDAETWLLTWIWEPEPKGNS